MKKLLLLLTFVPHFLFGQLDTIGLPFVTNFSPDDYHAYSQNWSIAQDNDGIMYFANTDGLLVYDGNSWQLIYMPNGESVINLVVTDSNKVYLSGDDLFGRIEPDLLGNLHYVSLLEKIPEIYRNEQLNFRYLKTYNETIYSRTSTGLFVYENDTVSIIETGDLRNFFITSQNQLFLIYSNQIAWSNEGGKHTYTFTNRVIDLIEKDNSIFAITDIGEVFVLEDNKFIFHHQLLYDLSNLSLFGVKLYKNKYLIFHTYKSGIIIVDFEGNLYNIINGQGGLLSDCVYNVYADTYNNLWLATNMGISYVELASPLRMVDERLGYDGELPMFVGKFKDFLYANTGFKLNKIKLRKNYDTKIEYCNTKNSQMWSGLEIDGTYYIAQNPQLLRIDRNENFKIYGPNDCIFNISKIRGTENDYLLGGYVNLYHYKYNGDSLIYQKTLKNVTNNCRRVYFENDKVFWAGGSVDGAIRITLTDSITIEKTEIYGESKGLSSTNSLRFIKWRDTLLLSTFDKLFYYDTKSDTIKEFEPIMKKFDVEDSKSLQLIKIDSRNVFWFEYFNKNHEYEIFCFKYNDSTKEFEETNIFAKKMLDFGLFSIQNYSKDRLLLATSKGYVFINYKDSCMFNSRYNVYIRKVGVGKNDTLIYGGQFLTQGGGIRRNITAEDLVIIDYKNNDISFEYSTPFYINKNKIQYRVKLVNFDNEWSNWGSANNKEYNNLSPGKYIFKVEAKNIFGKESQVSSYYFYITAPWYRSVWAYIAYFVIIILFIYLIVKFFTYRLRIRNEELEITVEKRTFEITAKNAELLQQKEEIESQKEEIESQRDIVVKHSKDIEASIKYAYKIQKAVIPDVSILKDVFKNYFIFFKPRDIVSGDFYWVAQKDTKTIIAAADCTGHGVPGAFMSMLGISFLNQIIRDGEDLKASEMLDTLRNMVINSLKQDISDNNSSKDGMDISLVIFDAKNNQIQFSGAYNSLYIISEQAPKVIELSMPIRKFELDANSKKLSEIRADRMPIGVFIREVSGFYNNLIQLQPKDRFYIFSDGFADMFDKETGKKFTSRRMKKLLLKTSDISLDEQFKKITNKYLDWNGDYKQIDDILILGIEIK